MHVNGSDLSLFGEKVVLMIENAALVDRIAPHQKSSLAAPGVQTVKRPGSPSIGAKASDDYHGSHPIGDRVVVGHENSGKFHRMEWEKRARLVNPHPPNPK